MPVAYIPVQRISADRSSCRNSRSLTQRAGVAFLVYTILTLSLTVYATGAPYSGNRNTKSGSTSAFATLYRTGNGDTRLTLRAAGTSSERFLFSALSGSTTNEAAVHYLGNSLSQTSNPRRATLSIFRDRAFLFFTSRRRARPIVIEAKLSGSRKYIVVRRAQVHRGRPGQMTPCAAYAPASSNNLPPTPSSDFRPDQAGAARGGEAAILPLRELEMEVFYEPSFTTPVGGDRREYISATIHAANHMYLSRMGIEARARRLSLLEFPLSASDPVVAEELLERFRAAVIQGSRSTDLYHLFTGAPLDRATAGVAYVGSACIDRGRYAVGLSRSVPPVLQPIVFAHEVMHGLGAVHDDAPYSVMSPVLTTNSKRLSYTTRRSVVAYIEEHGACIKPPRDRSALLNIGVDSGLFSASVVVRRPPTIPCEVLLQGRLLPTLSPSDLSPKKPAWRNIIQVRLPPVETADFSLLTLTAPAPIVQSRMKIDVRMRALVRCMSQRLITNTKQLLPPLQAAVGASDDPDGDYIDQLRGSIALLPPG